MLFIKDRVAINVLAKDLNNAKGINAAAQGHALIGILAKDFPNVGTAIAYVKQFQTEIGDVASVGLGAGDALQGYNVIAIAQATQPKHINQVFSLVGNTRSTQKRDDTLINCLISPTGQIGYVKISTGPYSQDCPPAIVDVNTAMAMAKEMKASAIKFFPMAGVKHLEEFKVVAAACAQHDLFLEPTGGIDLDNYQTILQIALDAGVKKIIPHVYSSIIDKTTQLTNPEAVKKLIALTEELL